MYNSPYLQLWYCTLKLEVINHKKKIFLHNIALSVSRNFVSFHSVYISESLEIIDAKTSLRKLGSSAGIMHTGKSALQKPCVGFEMAVSSQICIFIKW